MWKTRKDACNSLKEIEKANYLGKNKKKKKKRAMKTEAEEKKKDNMEEKQKEKGQIEAIKDIKNE